MIDYFKHNDIVCGGFTVTMKDNGFRIYKPYINKNKIQKIKF